MKTYQEFVSEAKKCWSGYKKKGTQKLFGKTYNRCVKAEDYEYELDESYDDEKRGRRRRGPKGLLTLARGRGADMTRQERTTAAIAKKAGLKGTGKYSTKDLRSKTKGYSTDDSYGVGTRGSTKQDHLINTYSSARKAAKDEGLISKGKRRFTDSGWKTSRVEPSIESVRRVRDFRKQMTNAGADKTGKVHSVDIIHRDMSVSKGDKRNQIERGKNLIKAMKDTPEHLRNVGAKRGDTVVGTPSAVMSGEDEKTGKTKRAKLYKKIFGKKISKMSNKTGLMVGKVD